MEPRWNHDSHRAIGGERRQYNSGDKGLRKESVIEPWRKAYPGLQVPRTDLIQEFVGSHSKKHSLKESCVLCT